MPYRLTRIAAKERARALQAGDAKLSYQQALTRVAAEQGYATSHQMIAEYLAAGTPIRRLDRGSYDGKATIPFKMQPWIYSGLYGGPRDNPGKWCLDCTAEEADLVYPRVLDAIAAGKFVYAMRSTEVIAERRDGFHLVLAFVPFDYPEYLKASLEIFRKCGATGEIFFKSDARTMREEIGYDRSSLEFE